MSTRASAQITLYDQTDATALVIWHIATTGAAPSAPTTTQASATPSGWSRAEPTVSSAADLAAYVYDCMQLVWGDGSCSWGDVTLSASFEAAKVAWNKANQTAQEVEDARDEHQSLSERFSSIDRTLDGITLSVSERLTSEQVAQAIEGSGDLIYDHTYAKADGVYVFQASLRLNGRDVTDQYDPDRFVWYLRNEGGDVLWARGPVMTVGEGDVDYRTSIVGGFEEEGAMMDATLADAYGNALVTSDGACLSARIIWED